MSLLQGFFATALVVVAVVLLRVFADRLDRERIASYLRDRRAELLSCHWAPFGKGWLGERSDRIYEIRYRDRDGGLREATVKTSMLTGVYLTGERRAVDADAVRLAAREDGSVPAVGDATSSLQRENERLAAEVECLRAEAERLRDRGR